MPAEPHPLWTGGSRRDTHRYEVTPKASSGSCLVLRDSELESLRAGVAPGPPLTNTAGVCGP
jgi:hypothetical protein